MLIGFIIGESLGLLLGIGTNVGGVGFAMVCLLLTTDWLKKTGRLTEKMQKGISFWKGMYIPVVVAMSASQNVVSAISQGAVAIVAGAGAVCVVFLIMALISRTGLLS